MEAFLCLLMALFFSIPPIVSAQDQYLSLKELTGAIHEAITNAGELSDQEPYFLVQKVKLELRGKQDTEGEAGFSIPIFSAAVDLGTEFEESFEEKLAIEMQPASTMVVGGETNIDLTGLITDLKEAFARKKEEQPHFVVNSVVYEQTWALQRSAEGGINFVIAKAGTAISEEKRQKITFFLCETYNFIDCVGD
jgi:hypothetical protein